MKELIGEIIGIIIIGSLGLILLSLIVNLILLSLEIRNKVAWTIKLPKKKKYLIKVDPIYEIYQEDYWPGYRIRKWGLKWDQPEKWEVRTFLFSPYPIRLEKFGYVVENSFFLCDHDKITLLDPDRSIEDTYNELYLKWKTEDDIKVADQKLKEEILEGKNKIFKQNYE